MKENTFKLHNSTVKDYFDERLRSIKVHSWILPGGGGGLEGI